MATDTKSVFLNKENFDIGLYVYYNGEDKTVNDEIDQYLEY